MWAAVCSLPTSWGCQPPASSLETELGGKTFLAWSCFQRRRLVFTAEKSALLVVITPRGNSCVNVLTFRAHQSGHACLIQKCFHSSPSISNYICTQPVPMGMVKVQRNRPDETMH
eukprot:EG_transcript_59904